MITSTVGQHRVVVESNSVVTSWLPYLSIGVAGFSICSFSSAGRYRTMWGTIVIVVSALFVQYVMFPSQHAHRAIVVLPKTIGFSDMYYA
eukprot:5266601-Amphidinium_carterae.1